MLARTTPCGSTTGLWKCSPSSEKSPAIIGWFFSSPARQQAGCTMTPCKSRQRKRTTASKVCVPFVAVPLGCLSDAHRRLPCVMPVRSRPLVAQTMLLSARIHFLTFAPTSPSAAALPAVALAGPGPSPPRPRPNQPLGRHSLTPAPAPHATSSTFLHRGPKHSTAAREMPPTPNQKLPQSSS